MEDEVEPNLREAAREGKNPKLLAKKVKKAVSKQEDRELNRYVFLMTFYSVTSWLRSYSIWWVRSTSTMRTGYSTQ